MFKKIFQESIDEQDKFSVVVILESSKYWLILYENRQHKFIGFWSTDDNGFMQAGKLFEIIRERINNSTSYRTIYDATTIFLEGWDYWGSFIPKPISEFIEYDFTSIIN